MNSLTDQELLREYSERGSEAAFAELVRRHVDFVHSAAVRMVNDAHLAEDVAQGVFLALARNAASLSECAVVSGWLHGTARNLAANTVRSEVRRRLREQEAAVMNEITSAENEPSWEAVSPLLDAGLEELEQGDRDVLLLRFFQRKTAREIGLCLGTSEEAAQKRVSRAIERLRAFFLERGVAASAAGLATLMAANGVQAAPAGLATTILAAASLSGAALAGSATVTTNAAVAAAVTKTVVMTTLQKTTVGIILAGALGSAVYQAHRVATLSAEVQTLQRQAGPLNEQVEILQHERDEAELRLAGLVAQLEAAKDRPNELLKLRAEVTRMRQQIKDAGDPFVRTAMNWKERESRLRQLFLENPTQNIPELRLLDQQAWLNAAMNADLDSEAGRRQTMSDLRASAENGFVIKLNEALSSYMATNHGQFPAEIGLLRPFLDSPDADALLERYEFRSAKEFPTHFLGGDWYITQRAAVDPELDARWVIGANGFGQTRFQESTNSAPSL